MKVLIVKLSSMGDVIHTLPAISDATKAIPGIQFDWVVDHAFADIPKLHSSVNKIIQSKHRYWKRNIKATMKNREINIFLKALREKKYDLIIDAQSSLKSAVITRLARGKRCGMDRKSVREFGAHFFYQKKYRIEKKQHAITRLRKLFAFCLDYNKPNTKPDACINKSLLKKPDISLEKPYLVFITNSSWPSKNYPEKYWGELIQLASEKYQVLLPWGSQSEYQVVKQLQNAYPNAVIIPKLTLSELGYILNNSEGVISIDTGLGHLASALNIPTVALYGPTDPELIGINGEIMQADFHCLNCYKKQCFYEKKPHQQSVCMTKLLPKDVWQHFHLIVDFTRPKLNSD